ncbi:proline-serine-threonine phosphatase-interacting protein 1 isoform X1 [Nematostella vectensis]|uniref:proline-serine-threonine phosphatase-interacting protein 1 isoform X1 n=1 Tax=Nematostella vectensis TaxID=45351 RepID=UPI00138FCF83|nr:proline-serine-threonine phosphatase-interacting protein 1 isoform X1 [Nematostella vectensis]
MTKFVDCFWGTEFTSTAGFDALSKRMRDGKQTCQEMEEFVKQRADIEEKYGKSLMRLAKTSEAKDEIGTLKSSWDSLRNETENIGKAHVALAQQLLDSLEKGLQEFRENQKETRKKLEDSVKRSQRNKKTCYENLHKLKRTYEQKCREKEAADDALKKSVSMAAKDEEKLRSKLGKCKTAVEQADSAYQTSVRVLDDTRVVWEREMATCCNVFQNLEEERIAFLRNWMWLYANLGSINCVKVDEMYEVVRQSLEGCNVDQDIKLFISMRQTGSERPSHIDYENYYMVQSSQKTSPLSGGSVNIGGPIPGSLTHSRDMVQVGRPGGRLPAALPAVPTEENADLYTTVNEVLPPQKPTARVPARPKERYFRALYEYEAQGDQELSFKASDIIRFLYEEDDTWCCGELNGKKGMFPKEFVDWNT